MCMGIPPYSCIHEMTLNKVTDFDKYMYAPF